MPGPKIDRSRHKKNHKGGARGAGGLDGIIARNAEVPGNPQPKNRNPVDQDDSSSSEEDEPSGKPVQLQKNEPEEDDGGMMGFERGSLNAALGDEDAMLAGGMTRKQREEIEKERKRKAYEKLHKEGKTEEAQKDMARLAEVRARRAAADKERKDAEAAAAEKDAAKRGGSNKEYLEALGGEKNRKLPGKRTGGPRHDEGSYAAFEGVAPKPEAIDPNSAVKGSIEACRLEEEDFM